MADPRPPTTNIVASSYIDCVFSVATTSATTAFASARGTCRKRKKRRPCCDSSHRSACCAVAVPARVTLVSSAGLSVSPSSKNANP